MPKDHSNPQKRNLKFADKIATGIWQETPAPYNPYLAIESRCHGYDLFELAEKRSFVDVLFLLFRGELPTSHQTALLEKLMIFLINPGPRHPATRATMNAAVSRTAPAHLLPIGLCVLSGEHLGANETLAAMRFLRDNHDKDPVQIADGLLVNSAEQPEPGADLHIAPGFGLRFGDQDPMAMQAAGELARVEMECPYLEWGEKFVARLSKQHFGWLTPGIAAAVFCELGFENRAAAGLFQLFSAPGLLAHGLEMADKPLTAMPFPDDDHYILGGDAKKK